MVVRVLACLLCLGCGALTAPPDMPPEASAPVAGLEPDQQPSQDSEAYHGADASYGGGFPEPAKKPLPR